MHGTYPPNPGAARPPLRPVPPPPRGTASFWVAIILGILLLLSIALNMVLFFPLLSRTKTDLVEVVDPEYGVSDAHNKIAVITVEGELRDEDRATFFGTSLGPVSFLRKQLAMAADDDSVKAVILEIDSPGGSVTASDKMFHNIESFRKKTSKPVIVFMKSIAASGGYYIAARADRIILTPTGITGSIGVIMMLMDISEAMDYLRIKLIPLKSGAFKDAGSPFREMPPAERKYFQKIVDGMYARFVDIVYDGRKDKALWENRDQVLKIADGRIYNAQQAKENGLIDDIGYFEDAVSAAIAATPGLETARIVRYGQRRGGGLSYLFGGAKAPSGDYNMIKIDAGSLVSLQTPKFLYKWHPDIRPENTVSQTGAP